MADIEVRKRRITYEIQSIEQATGGLKWISAWIGHELHRVHTLNYAGLHKLLIYSYFWQNKWSVTDCLVFLMLLSVILRYSAIYGGNLCLFFLFSRRKCFILRSILIHTAILYNNDVTLYRILKCFRKFWDNLYVSKPSC